MQGQDRPSLSLSLTSKILQLLTIDAKSQIDIRTPLTLGTTIFQMKEIPLLDQYIGRRHRSKQSQENISSSRVKGLQAQTFSQSLEMLLRKFYNLILFLVFSKLPDFVGTRSDVAELCKLS